MATEAEKLAQAVSALANDIENDLSLRPMGPLIAERMRKLLDKKHGGLEEGAAELYVEWFNRRFQRKFSASKDVQQLMKRLMDMGYTLSEMQLVAEHLHKQWAADPKMADYHRPTTCLRAFRFQEYLDLANEQRGTPRPTAATYKPPVVDKPVPYAEIRGLVGDVVSRLKGGG